MASGVEMLGQMSETDALAGPVQGGNMVVKPNEVPVGGAAMLAKAMRGQANKGVGGIYELPSQEPKIPEFMQIAKAGMQQGDPMRGQGPRKGLTPFDMANMEGAAMQAGIINFLGGQPEVTAPIRAQSHADAPPTELAYITAAEKQMLLDANMHGSLEGNQPNPGPAGIQSLDDFYNKPGGGVGGGSGEQVAQSGADNNNNNNDNNYSGGGGGYQSIEDAIQGFEPGMAVGGSDNDTVFRKDPKSGGQNQPRGFTADEELTAKLAKQEEEKQQDFLSKLAAKNKDSEKKSKEQVKLEAERNAIFNKGEDNMDAKDGKRLREIQKLIADMSTSGGSLLDGMLDNVKKIPKAALKKLKEFGIIGKEIKDIKSLPQKTQTDMMDLLNDFERLKVSPKEALMYQSTMGKSMSDGEFRDDEDGKDTDKLTLQGLTKRLRGLDTGGGASVLESLKKYEPELYYDKFRVGQTSGDLESFARNDLAVKDSKGNYTIGKDKRPMTAEKAKRYNNAIFDARQQGRENNNNNQNNRPQVMEQTIDNMEVMPGGTVVDEESQTMEYNSPRTGGATTSVPLQRRFRTDPTQDVAQIRTAPRTEADILKYMTQGTTGEGIGLEPFSEYQRRRRKALGQDELGLFN